MFGWNLIFVLCQLALTIVNAADNQNNVSRVLREILVGFVVKIMPFSVGPHQRSIELHLLMM